MESKVICNACGRTINTEKQDFLTMKKHWGYFSKKDLEIHEFTLCEECYDRMIKSFNIPVKITETTEVL
jgi:ribosomal-protein-alanine N-acetyltransferase